MYLGSETCLMFGNSMPKATPKKLKPNLGGKLDVLKNPSKVFVPLVLEGGNDPDAAQDKYESKSPTSDPGYLSEEAASESLEVKDIIDGKHNQSQQHHRVFLEQSEVMKTSLGCPWKGAFRGIKHWPDGRNILPWEYVHLDSFIPYQGHPKKEIPWSRDLYKVGSDYKSIDNDVQVNGFIGNKSPSSKGNINWLDEASYGPKKRKSSSELEVQSHRKHKERKTSNGALHGPGNGVISYQEKDKSVSLNAHQLGHKKGNYFQPAKGPIEAPRKGNSTVSVIKFNRVGAHAQVNAQDASEKAQRHGNSDEKQEIFEDHCMPFKRSLNRQESPSVDVIKGQGKMHKKSSRDNQVPNHQTAILTDHHMAYRLEKGIPANLSSRDKWVNTDKMEFHNEVSNLVFNMYY